MTRPLPNTFAIQNQPRQQTYTRTLANMTHPFGFFPFKGREAIQSWPPSQWKLLPTNLLQGRPLRLIPPYGLDREEASCLCCLQGELDRLHLLSTFLPMRNRNHYGHGRLSLKCLNSNSLLFFSHCFILFHLSFLYMSFLPYFQ